MLKEYKYNNAQALYTYGIALLYCIPVFKFLNSYSVFGNQFHRCVFTELFEG
ncbi:hypothetical protein HanIR_Chr14g0709871 [Helianthus annuus]|nr:hypothetical protein HanIR_Chr14g0709871 [Helianthus annuus]